MPYFTGPTLIDPPPAPPRPYGLFDVAMGPMPFPRPESIGGGVQYVPNICEDDFFLINMDCPPVTGTKTFSGVEFPISGAPFTVMTSYTCGSIGFSFEEVEQRVRTRMMLQEQKAVEKRLWTGSSGALGTITGLFANAPVLGAAACATEAIEMLEQQAADQGLAAPIIHARPGMSAHLAQAHQTVQVGRQKQTYLGTPISFGYGYAGTGPTGQTTDTNTEWMYLTGRVAIWQGDVWVSNPGWGINRATNQISVLAERPYAVAIECGVWAVSVTRNCSTTGAT